MIKLLKWYSQIVYMIMLLNLPLWDIATEKELPIAIIFTAGKSSTRENT